MPRVPVTILLVLLALAVSLPFNAEASGRVLKVLPHLLDLQGRHALSPALYQRDAYQVYLRNHSDEVSGIRYDINWKASAARDSKLKLRIELRSDAKDKIPVQKTIETEVKGRRSWSSLSLADDEYKAFGKVTAWRVTLWDGEKLLDEQKSFLW
jgi:hypothetical protein